MRRPYPIAVLAALTLAGSTFSAAAQSPAAGPTVSPATPPASTATTGSAPSGLTGDSTTNPGYPAGTQR